MEMMLNVLKPMLAHRDKIGYAAARNTRKLAEITVEYFQFKQELIQKYGTVDTDVDGNELQTISIKPNSQNFQDFTEEFDKIKKYRTRSRHHET